MDPIAVSREGDGPEVLLVHGGASAGTTWSGLAPLLSRWTLVTVHRRGFPPSPPARDGRQDFEVDAADIEPLLDRRPNVVAHSYGALGALIAAARKPAQVRSLTLIEPPLFYLTPDDPELRRFQLIGDEVLAMASTPTLQGCASSCRSPAPPSRATGRFPRTSSTPFAAPTAAARRERRVRGSTSCARRASRCSSPPAITPPSWSAPPMRSRPSCTPRG